MELPAQQLLEKAVVLHREGRAAEAEDLCRKVLRTEPENFEALYLLGVAALLAKDPAAAPYLAQAACIRPDSAEAHYGRAFADRVAASLLTAVQMPELIATSLDDYEAAAVDLARHTQKLNALKQKLARNRGTAPLFDAARFTRHMENAFEQMIARYQADLPPDHIMIDGTISL